MHSHLRVGGGFVNPAVLAAIKGYDRTLDLLWNATDNCWIVVQDLRLVQGIKPTEVRGPVSGLLKGCPSLWGKDSCTYKALLKLKAGETLVSVTPQEVLRLVAERTRRFGDKDAHAQRERHNQLVEQRVEKDDHDYNREFSKFIKFLGHKDDVQSGYVRRNYKDLLKAEIG